MMNTVIGIDVSKATLDVLWLRDVNHSKVKSKKLGNAPQGHQGHQDLLAWATKNTGEPVDKLRFVLEATGVYHEALAYALHEAGAEVVVLNPAQVRAYAKSLGVHTKNDRKDSMVLARFGATQPCRRWQPEPAEVRTLRALLSRLEALQTDLQRERNRQEKAQAGLGAAPVDRSIQRMIERLEQETAELNRQIDDHFDQHPQLQQDRERLETIPGIGPVLSRHLVATYRSRRFTKASQMAAYLGVVPIQSQSGTSVNKPPRMSKVGPAHLRAKLYMPAVVALRRTLDAKALYERLVAAGKAKKAALGAVMRKLVHIAFGVLKHQQAYVPQGTS